MSEDPINAWLQGVLSGSTPPLPGGKGSEQLLRPLSDNLQKAEWHGVTSLLYYILNENHKWSHYPDELQRQFAERTREIIAVALLWKQEITSIYQLFSKEHISSLLLKGFPLAYNLYAEPYLRLFGDVDILFPDRDTTERAGKLLETLGYTRPNEISGEYLCHQFSCTRQSTTGFVFTIGLHWRLNNANYFANAFSYDELASASVPVVLPGADMRTLSPVHSLLFACMHRLAHTVDGKADRLIWFYDLHLLAKSFDHSQWESFTELATGKNLCSACLDGLEKCRNRLNTHVPEEVIKTLKSHAVQERFKPLYNAPAWRYFFMNIQSLPGWSAKLKLLREQLFPSPEYMYARFNCRHKAMLPLLYIRRTAQSLPKLMHRNTIRD